MSNTVQLEPWDADAKDAQKRAATITRPLNKSPGQIIAPPSPESGDEILISDAIPMTELLSRDQPEISPEDLERTIRYYRTRMRVLLQAEGVQEPLPLYTDIKNIGAGGSGTVYKAFDPVTKKYLVLKIIASADIDQFDRARKEAKAIIELGKEEGIIRGYLLKRIGREGIPEIEHSSGKLLLETEYIEGGDLNVLHRDFFDRIQSLRHESQEKRRSENTTNFRKNDVPVEFRIFQYTKIDPSFLLSLPLPDHQGRHFSELSDQNPLTHREVQLIVKALEKQYRFIIIDLFSKACLALQKAHQAGVLHRDIKPENMILDKNGQLKIIDWGLVKPMHEQGEKARDRVPISFQDMNPNITDPDFILGTPHFIPPELTVSSSERGKITNDIWSLGATLTFLLTNIYPFTAVSDESPMQIMVRILRGEMINKQKIENSLDDPKLFQILNKALAHDPQSRFQSMEEFQAALLSYLNRQFASAKKVRNP